MITSDDDNLYLRTVRQNEVTHRAGAGTKGAHKTARKSGIVQRAYEDQNVVVQEGLVRCFPAFSPYVYGGDTIKTS